MAIETKMTATPTLPADHHQAAEDLGPHPAQRRHTLHHVHHRGQGQQVDQRRRPPCPPSGRARAAGRPRRRWCGPAMAWATSSIVDVAAANMPKLNSVLTQGRRMKIQATPETAEGAGDHDQRWQHQRGHHDDRLEERQVLGDVPVGHADVGELCESRQRDEAEQARPGPRSSVLSRPWSGRKSRHVTSSAPSRSSPAISTGRGFSLVLMRRGCRIVEGRHGQPVSQSANAQVRAAQVRAAQVRADQSSAAQVRAAQVASGPVVRRPGTGRPGASRPGAGRPGAGRPVVRAQVRAAQVRAAQSSPAQVRAAQVRASQSAPRSLSCAQARARPTCSSVASVFAATEVAHAAADLGAQARPAAAATLRSRRCASRWRHALANRLYAAATVSAGPLLPVLAQLLRGRLRADAGRCHRRRSPCGPRRRRRRRSSARP